MQSFKLEEEYTFCNLNVSNDTFSLPKRYDFKWTITVREFYSLNKNGFTIDINTEDGFIQKNILVEMILIQKTWQGLLLKQLSSSKIFNKNNMHDSLEFTRFSGCEYIDIKIKFSTYIPLMDSKESIKAENSSVALELKKETQSIADEENKMTMRDFFNNLNQLQQEGNYTDITIRCDTEAFRAHRIILSAKSPVFDAMFKSNMKETLNQEVVIKDMKPEVLRFILSNIYSNKDIQDSDPVDLVFDVLAAADKYMLKELKNSCVRRIKSSVSVTNVLKILLLADLYDTGLKEYVIQVICKEYDVLKNSSEWKEIQEEKPSLIFEVMAAKIEYMKINTK